MTYINMMARQTGREGLSRRIIDAVEAAENFDDLPDWAKALVIEAERTEEAGRRAFRD